jgi:hypothetical protein
MDLELNPADERLGLRGLAALVPSDGGWVPSRLPERLLPLVHPDLLPRVSMAAGGRFCFTTDATRVELRVTAPVGSNEVSPFDIMVDGVLESRQTIVGDGTVTLDLTGSAGRRVELWLPQFGTVRLGRLRLVGASSVAAAEELDPRWILYGSSISQCRESAGPSETWPALVARANGWNLRCLGFGAQCHLDPIVARYIRDTPTELIELCLGINIYGARTFTARSLGPAVAGFVLTVRDGHPDAPMVITTPITAPSRETTPNAAGLTLQDIRAIIEETVAALRDAGDANLRLLRGPEIFGPEDVGLLADGLHPSDEGYRLMAARLGPRLQELYS